MRKKTKTYNKVAKALADLGIEGFMEICICTIKKNNIDYMLYIDEDTETFSVMQYVSGLYGTLTKQEFDTALDVVKEFHKDYDGDWNDGTSYLSSPAYCLKGVKILPKEELEKILEDFFKAWSFMCANTCAITDDSIWDNLE